jgi:hypothetical protein
MRHLLLACLLLGPGPAFATEEPAAKAAPAGILLTGDSMMRVGVAPVLRRTLPVAIGEAVTTHAKSATGLARPDTYDWLAELPKFLKDRHYATAIVALGSNDCQNLARPGDKAIRYGTKEWETAYKARVKAVLELLCASAEQVLWLGLPPMRNVKFNGRVTSLNTLLEAEVEAASCARFVPVAPKLADGKGHFTQYVKVGKRKLRVREDDGVHLTQNGGRLVSELIVESLKK